jgi:hypothetical protein
MSKLNQIPSEYIEPYLAKFMGSMVDFVASAVLTEEEKQKRNGCGWTVAEVKSWIKGVELFVSHSCGIHAQYAMMNEMHRFTELPDEKLLEICKKVSREVVRDE